MGDQKNVIVFFGLGAVGATMLTCLAELSERDGIPVRFLVFVRNPEAARDALFHAERYFDRVQFVGLPTFDPVFALDAAYRPMLDDAWVLVNAALPALNRPLLELACRLGVHTVDLASDMYGDEARRALAFEQFDYDERMRARGATALVNLGISPGITNFLVGRRIHELRAAGRRELEIERVDLYLLEDIDADEIVFSWSPVVALEELAQNPRIVQDGRVVVLEPFSGTRAYTFPHERNATKVYPLYQEELLSFRRSFPEVASIGIWSGGSELELVKSLFKLNLLSKRSLPHRPELTIESMVRAILPGMNKPRRIEDFLRSGVIHRAHFAAAAEIRVSEVVRNDRQTVVETVGLSYLRYRGLLDTPYAGATYISYPTGVGAAILAWHALGHARSAPAALVGVRTGEDLAHALPRERIDAVRRDLVAWDIDLFESVRDATAG